jgi:hypothetical protein
MKDALRSNLHLWVKNLWNQHMERMGTVGKIQSEYPAGMLGVLHSYHGKDVLKRNLRRGAFSQKDLFNECS